MPLLWEAMQTVDPETGRSRGYLIVAKGFVSESLLFTIDKKRHQEFAQLAHWLQDAADTLPPLMADAVLRHGSGPDGGVDHVRLLPVFLETLPASVASMVVAFHNTLCVHYTEGHLRSIDHVSPAQKPRGWGEPDHSFHLIHPSDWLSSPSPIPNPKQLLEAIEAHPIYTQLATGGDSREAQLLGRFRARWEEHGHGLGCCDRSRAVSEKHVLTIFYISLLEWICLREGWPISRLFPHAVYSPPLQLEVGQLKRKFAAMAQAEEEAAAAAAGTCSIPAAGRSWSGVSTKQ